MVHIEEIASTFDEDNNNNNIASGVTSASGIDRKQDDIVPFKISVCGQVGFFLFFVY